MNTNGKVILGVLAVLVIGFFVFGMNDSSEVAVTGESGDQVATADHNDAMADTMDEKMADDMKSAEMKDDEMMKEDGAMMEDKDAMMKDEDTMMKDDKDMMDGAGEVVAELTDAAPLVAGVYTTYTADAVAGSDAEHIVLNFSATWCPSCRTLDKDINANLSQIPAGVEIYKVDYDTYTDLRREYGVTTQHTLVEVAADGTLIKKWSGGNDLDSVIAQL